MKLNLDEIYQRIEPWELILTLDGADRSVRRLTNVDLAQLQRFGEMTPDQSVAFVAGLFEGEPPAVREWDNPLVAQLLSTVLAYYREWVKKKATRGAEAAAAAVAEQMRTSASRS